MEREIEMEGGKDGGKVDEHGRQGQGVGGIGCSISAALPAPFCVRRAGISSLKLALTLRKDAGHRMEQEAGPPVPNAALGVGGWWEGPEEGAGDARGHSVGGGTVTNPLVPTGCCQPCWWEREGAAPGPQNPADK